MQNQGNNINSTYTNYYAKQTSTKVYPTEFVVRTLLANYPRLHFKKPKPGDKILDVGFGDGRNTAFLCECGLFVHGIEITSEIVELARARLTSLGHTPDLRVGRNSSIPFEDNKFDYILACHCCYYCDEGQTLVDNLREYARVLKNDGILIASVADKASYIFQDAKELPDGSMRIMKDPYKNRNGYRLHAFSTESNIEQYFSEYFKNFSFGRADNDYYGISERLFWVVCERK